MLRPNYQVATIDLSQPTFPGGATGQRDFVGDFNYVKVLRFVDGNGNLILSGVINFQLGPTFGDLVPLGYNSYIKGHASAWRAIWNVQAGTFAVVLFSLEDKASGAGIEADSPPAEQLITQAFGTLISTGNVVVGAAAVLLDNTANRDSLTIRALSTNTANVEYGGAGVAFGQGMPLAPGESATIDKTTAAIWAISNAAGQNVRVVVEHS